jgi:hypothetical protein
LSIEVLLLSFLAGTPDLLLLFSWCRLAGFGSKEFNLLLLGMFQRISDQVSLLRLLLIELKFLWEIGVRVFVEFLGNILILFKIHYYQI